jgi:hypothetical protein
MKNTLKISGAILLILFIQSCKEKPTPPVLTTTPVTAVSYTTATSGGEVTDEGGDPVISRGICWNTVADPTTSDSKTTESGGLGSFTSNITSLNQHTKYYVRAYGTNTAGTGYGDQVTFTTLQIVVPVLTTTAITTITQTSAVSGGNITDDKGATVTARGTCWSTNQVPTVFDNKTTDGTGSGSFISSLTGLVGNTTYYVRAYATNSAGTAYGAQLNFSTLGPPAITTADVTGITQTTAASGGNITNDGGTAVSARGVCWSTNWSTTISDSKTNDESGTGTFTSNITGLTGNTTYYIRAYATNSIGTSYGNQVSFKTSPVIPTITTATPNTIAQTTASCGGNVTNDGGGTITERGVCFGTTANPTITNPTITATGTTGTFTCSITGLTEKTTYYVRAYATNIAGTAYGNEVTFTTLLPLPTLTNFPDITKNFGDPTFTLTPPTSNSSGTFYFSSNNLSVASVGGTTVTIIGSGTAIIRAYQEETTSYSVGIITATITVNAILPTITTTAPTNVSATTATSGGNIISNGGTPLTVSGICWSTAQDPVVTGSCTTNGSLTGGFASNITGLTISTEYFVRAYATNSVGTAYGTNLTFTTTNGIPLAPAGVSATAGDKQVTIDWGVVSDATSYNIYWSTTPGVTKANGTKITDVAIPYIHTGRTNVTKYYYVVTSVNSYGESNESAEVNAIPQTTDTGWGGLASQYINNGIIYVVRTFNYNANFYPPANLTQVRVLIVGSGGNGGGVDWDCGGGGGGGEVKDLNVSITGSSMAVSVSTDGGSVSSFGGQTAVNGSAGENGKGGNGGTSGSGKAGGIGLYRAGGGGGGGTYGYDGIADSWNPIGGKGGDGTPSNITGTLKYYGGGGGGGAWTGYDGRNGEGGLGGGGGVGNTSNGTSNTGGGGVGASYTSGGGYSGFTLGGSGGSGVVIISYPLN